MTLSDRAKVSKALGHPARLAMVERLGLGECCVCELLERTEFNRLSGPTVSQHLLVLKNAGIIGNQKLGKKIFYLLLMPCVAQISLCVASRDFLETATRSGKSDSAEPDRQMIAS
jgi:DNA-binding transcriptional ArsR family regulator